MALLTLDRLQTYAEGLDHSEGICVAPDGHIYVGGEAGQIYRIRRGEAPEVVANVPGFALGLTADAESRIYVCDHASSTVWRVDPATGACQAFSTGAPERAMRVPNWSCFDAEGRLYVSDSGGWGAEDGLIWRIAGGRAEVWCEEVRGFPNGMALSADGGSLFVLESNPAALTEIPIGADGRPGSPVRIASLDGTVPDGVAVTTSGQFVVACYRPDTILLISRDGRVEVIAEDPKGTALAAPTNVVFFGAGLDRMLVPNLGRWHVTEFAVAGLAGIPLNYPSAAAIGS